MTPAIDSSPNRPRRLPLHIGHRRVPFDNAGYLFVGVLVCSLFGFLPAYSPGSFDRHVEFDGYTHVHAGLMSTWLALLIVQPFLIRGGRRALHRQLGRASYVIVPAVVVAGLLLVHSRVNPSSSEPPMQLYLSLRDLSMLSILFTLAMVHRRSPAYHARFMAGMLLPLLEPGLSRAIGIFGGLPDPVTFSLTWLVIDSILLYLVLRDWRAPEGRWIFRVLLLAAVLGQVLIVVGLPMRPWFRDFAAWFAELPLT